LAFPARLANRRRWWHPATGAGVIVVAALVAVVLAVLRETAWSVAALWMATGFGAGFATSGST